MIPSAYLPAARVQDKLKSETIIIDGPDKPSPTPIAGGKRKRGGLADEELQAFSSMTDAVKEVAQAIRDNKPTNIHLDLYSIVMNVIEYSQDALMAALSHLVNPKAQGTNFVGMADAHMALRLWNYLSKHYFSL
jgi:hypothetical protein